MPLGQIQQDVGGANIAVKIAEMVDENYWDAIHIASPELAGIISGVNIHDYTITQSYSYSSFPVPIPLGHEVYAACCGRNKGTDEQRMTLIMQLSDPDGIIRSQNSYTFNVVPDDFGCANTLYDRCVIDKIGTWILYIRLEAELA